MSHHQLNATSTFLGLGTYFMFSVCDALSRLLMQQGYSQPQVVGCIMGLALGPVLFLTAYENAWRRLRPRHPGLVALSALMGCAECFCAFYAFAHLRYLVEAYALFFTMPLWTALLAALLLKEHLSRAQIIAILTGFAGVLIANWPQDGTSPLSWAHIAGLIAPLLSSLRILVTRKLGQRDGGLSLIFAIFIGVTLFNAAIMPAYMPFTTSALPVLLLAGMAQGTAHVCFLLAARKTAAPLLAPFQYSQVLWALVFGVLIFAEWPQANTYAGLALVVTGGAMLLKKPETA